MKNNNTDKPLKKNQSKKEEGDSLSFPQEHEEQRSDNIRMKPQPLDKPKKQ